MSSVRDGELTGKRRYGSQELWYIPLARLRDRQQKIDNPIAREIAVMLWQRMERSGLLRPGLAEQDVHKLMLSQLTSAMPATFLKLLNRLSGVSLAEVVLWDKDRLQEFGRTLSGLQRLLTPILPLTSGAQRTQFLLDYAECLPHRGWKFSWKTLRPLLSILLLVLPLLVVIPLLFNSAFSFWNLVVYPIALYAAATGISSMTSLKYDKLRMLAIYLSFTDEFMDEIPAEADTALSDMRSLTEEQLSSGSTATGREKRPKQILDYNLPQLRSRIESIDNAHARNVSMDLWQILCRHRSNPRDQHHSQSIRQIAGKQIRPLRERMRQIGACEVGRIVVDGSQVIEGRFNELPGIVRQLLPAPVARDSSGIARHLVDYIDLYLDPQVQYPWQFRYRLVEWLYWLLMVLCGVLGISFVLAIYTPGQTSLWPSVATPVVVLLLACYDLAFRTGMRNEYKVRVLALLLCFMDEFVEEPDSASAIEVVVNG